jgi:hypothetical protein
MSEATWLERGLYVKYDKRFLFDKFVLEALPEVDADGDGLPSTPETATASDSMVAGRPASTGNSWVSSSASRLRGYLEAGSRVTSNRASKKGLPFFADRLASFGVSSGGPPSGWLSSRKYMSVRRSR